MNKVTAIIFLALMSMCSCDMVSSEEQKLVGNISIVNPHTQSDTGYSLVAYYDGFNHNILNNYVIDVIGDDEILLVTCIDSNRNYLYYKISHQEGNTPIDTMLITKALYLADLNVNRKKYSFSVSK